MDTQTELASLRNAVRMMGIDPDRLISFCNEPADAVCKGILLQCVGLDEAALRERAGVRTNMEGWRSVWAYLLQPSTSAPSNPPAMP